MSKRERFAWAAGIIDGEGCIALVRHPAAHFSGAVSDRYHLILKVTMCCPITPRRLYEIFETGSLSSRTPKPDERVSQSFSWICNSRQAEKVLHRVYPYLVTKQKEADVALEFLALPLAKRGGRKGGRPVDPELQRARVSCFERLRDLKTRNRFRVPATTNTSEAHITVDVFSPAD